MRKIPEIIIETSRKLRKEMTEAEKILWDKLKSKQLENRYIIAEFLSRKYNLIIELDWSIHNLKEVYKLDKHKEQLLSNLWYKILRFKNEEIQNNLEKTLSKIATSFSW